jgi:putative transposase
MDREKIKVFAEEGAKGIKTEGDLTAFMREILKTTLETALQAELSDHLGYEKHQTRASSNARNGSTSKMVKSQQGEIEIATPRDREGSFAPQLVPKHQTRLTHLDDQILSLYAKGMTTREIADTFQEMYGADVSPTLISKVTDAVMARVVEWQNRPLEALYPIMYLDCIVVKVRQDNRVINKSVFLALGVNLDGHKEVLGLWIAENEGAKFWLSVLTDLQNRGVKDILIACVDGLTGFPDAINTVFPQTQVQRCIVHMVRTSLKYVAWKDYKAVTTDLKAIYQSATEEQALLALDAFAEKWDGQYPAISRAWRANWAQLNPFFAYPADIRKVIYTTNAIESLNSVIRHATKKRKIFASDESVRKVLFLAIQNAAKKWTMPIANWRQAMARFMILFEDRLKPYL